MKTFRTAVLALLLSCGAAFAQQLPPLGGGVLGGFPVGATALGGSSGNVAAATAAATLTAAATGKTAYFSAFKFTSSGATAASIVICTVTGLAIGTQSYVLASVIGAVLGNQPLIVSFIPPQPASAINTNIVASCPSLGVGNTNAAMNAEGYLQ